MRKLILYVLASLFCFNTVVGCSKTSAEDFYADMISTTYFVNDNAPDYEAESYIPDQFIISLPNPEWGANSVGEIINNAGIEYEYSNNKLCFSSSAKVIFTFEAFDSNGVRLNYSCLYPDELGVNVDMAQFAYRDVEVATWFVYLDPANRTVNNEVRLMAWTPYNDSNGDLVGLFKFMRSSETQTLRPLVISYDVNGRITLAGAPGMDVYLHFGDDAEGALWNEIPDMSRIETQVLEITVGENYLPDENGIRFVGVGHPGRTDVSSDVLIICDVQTLEVTYSGGAETLVAFNGIAFTRLRFSEDDLNKETITINGKEYPKGFFGEYERNVSVIIDEQCGQPVFHENDLLRDYEIVLASNEQ